ncbi:aspartate kinase [Eubacteriales bacterium OttesenSCG-928-M02]|nr:aspartate kinase [Eubacteriales bacterium OttesenSCG-928-M02]
MAVKIAKFGGSSLATAQQFEKVAAIIKADGDRRYVVPSAPGKAPGLDEKVTDMLYACSYAYNMPECASIFARIVERYEAIIKGLGLNLDLSDDFARTLHNIQNEYGNDYAASRGEYFNGMILAEYLGFPFLDAADCICFDEEGNFNESLTDERMGALLKKHPYGVIPGFYGADPDGNIVTFSRGGSDITGALVARAAKADIYENWTDVDGCLKADPRIVQNPITIPRISYSELRELSYMGASVLHDESIFPVREAGIPINIKNTNHPDHPGTMIQAHIPEEEYDSAITGIAGRKGFTSIQIEKSKMNNEVGFARKVLSVLEEENISLEHMPTGIDTLSVIVTDGQLEGKLDRVIKKIYQDADPDRVDVEENLALIATVGHGMIRRVGVSAQLFSALAEAGVNIRMIDQGSSELNIIVGVAEEDFETAVNAIYKGFQNG